MLSSVKLEPLWVRKQTLYRIWDSHAGSDITNTGSDVISHVTIKQSPTTWCQKVKIVPPSLTHHYTHNHNFCNFGGSLMKDPGKWNGSINYINGTIMEGIIPRYQEEGKWMRWLCRETIKDLIKGYFWCPGIHERKTIIIFRLLSS